MLIGNPERGRQTDAYLRALDEGMPIAEAVQAAYGASVGELDEEIRTQRARGRIGGYRLHFDAPLPGTEATAAAARVQWGVVERSLRQKEPAGEADDVDLVEMTTDEERAKPSPGPSAMLQPARAAALPFTGDPHQGISATLTIAGIDALLLDRGFEDTLALVQQSVAIHPTHVELASAEAGLCLQFGRDVAALASASRAARYTRSPELRRRIEGWVQELEAEAVSSR